MGKRAAFTVVMTRSAEAEFDALRVFEQRKVTGAIESSLVFEPTVESRKRKKLRDLPAGFAYSPPLRELKLGEIRVYYDVDEDGLKATVRAIRRKPPELTTEEVLR